MTLHHLMTHCMKLSEDSKLASGEPRHVCLPFCGSALMILKYSSLKSWFARSFLMEHLGIHYKECTPAAEAVRTAILHMCSACIPAFLASATGYPEPRPAATVHGRLQLLLLMVDATKDSIGLDADKRKGNGVGRGYPCSCSWSSGDDSYHMHAVLMATSALRQISQATVAVFSESAAAWCSLWLGMEIHAHISIVLQLANALTSLGNRVVSLSKVMAFASQHVSQALKEQDLAVLLCQVEADRLR